MGLRHHESLPSIPFLDSFLVLDTPQYHSAYFFASQILFPDLLRRLCLVLVTQNPPYAAALHDGVILDSSSAFPTCPGPGFVNVSEAQEIWAPVHLTSISLIKEKGVQHCPGRIRVHVTMSPKGGFA
jgi:hypothetical protein